MNDFIFHNPAKVYFGKNQLEHLPEELAAFGTKVLMVYGGGSIKKSGLYDEVRGLLEGAGMELFELAGVEPNPWRSCSPTLQPVPRWMLGASSRTWTSTRRSAWAEAR